jgi:hypothetical protein
MNSAVEAFALLFRRMGRFGAALGAFLGASASVAQATEITPPPMTDANAWSVTVSVIGAVAPSFPGSSQMRPFPFPAVSFRRVGEP